MGFWDSVNDELKKAVEEGWTAVKENAKIGKLRYRVHQIQKDARKHLSEIGAIVYDSVKYGKNENLSIRADVTALVEKIKKLEAEAESLQKEIENLRGKEAAAAGKPS